MNDHSTHGPTIWKVVDDKLLLQRTDDLLIPTADQIYTSIIEGKSTFDDVEPGHPKELEYLEFSKYPAHLEIQLYYRPAEGNTGLTCEVHAVVGKSKAVIHDFEIREADHIVIEGKWYPFSSGALEETRDLFGEAGVKETGEISFRAYLHLRDAAQDNDLIRDHTVNQTIHPGIGPENLDCVPHLFNGRLYPYQADGWRWLNFLCKEQLGGILADEMGLGKTIQVIAVLATPNREAVAPSLIVAPSTLLENWRREIGRFSPSLKVSVHQGSSRTGLPAKLEDNDVVITSYDTLVRDGALFGMVGWKLAVLDEAQMIRNPETRRAIATKKIKRNVGLAVTGTPVENRLRDLWSIMDFALPGYLGSEKEFESRFGEGVDAGIAVEPYISPLMLRRKIMDVAQDLPERIDIPQILKLSTPEAQEYERIRLDILDKYGQNASLVSLISLRMYCSHPSLLDRNDLHRSNPTAFSKFVRLLEIIREIFENSEKVLIFTSYHAMSDLIVNEVSKLFGVYTNSIDGRSPVTGRQEVVDQFSSTHGPALLALNPKAAGTGLNITAANHVVHYNLEWNPAVEDQASARAYRRGQDKPVTIHRLIFADTVEEVIQERLERKRDVAKAAVVGVSGREKEYEDMLFALQRSPV